MVQLQKQDLPKPADRPLLCRRCGRCNAGPGSLDRKGAHATAGLSAKHAPRLNSALDHVRSGSCHVLTPNLLTSGFSCIVVTRREDEPQVYAQERLGGGAAATGPARG